MRAPALRARNIRNVGINNTRMCSGKRNNMIAQFVGEIESTATYVRTLIARHGHQCPSGDILGFDDARRVIAQTQPPPHVIFVHCDGRFEAALNAISQIRKLAGPSLIAIGERSDTDTVLRAVRSGAQDYLHLGERFEIELDHLLRRLVQGTEHQRSTGRIISVFGASGGCGASTVAVNLAAEMARQQGRCALLDLNLCGGDLAALLDLKPLHHIVDLCHSQHSVDRAMFEQSLLSHGSGIHLLAAPPVLEDIGTIEPENISQIVHLAASDFSHVVIDLEDIFHREQTVALQASDAIVIVLRLDFICLMRTRRTLAHLSRLGISRNKIMLVANRFGQASELPRHKVREALGLHIAFGVPEDPKTILTTTNLGNPAVLEARSTKVARSMIDLAVQVCTL